MFPNRLVLNLGLLTILIVGIGFLIYQYGRPTADGGQVSITDLGTQCTDGVLTIRLRLNYPTASGTVAQFGDAAYGYDMDEYPSGGEYALRLEPGSSYYYELMLYVDRNNDGRPDNYTAIASDSVTGNAPSCAGSSPTTSPVSIDTNPSHYSAELVSQSTQRVSVRAGEQLTIEARVRNTGQATWYQKYVNLGTVETQDRCPGFDTVSGWYKCNRAHFQESSVAPGEIATYRMTWQVPTNKISYTFHEAFRLVVDEVVWFSTPTIAWDVTTLPAATTAVTGPVIDSNSSHYAYQLVSQSASSQTISRGGTATFTIKIRNTGTATWYQDYLSLGTTHLQDNVPGFDIDLADRAADGWYKCNRARFQESQVAPGEIATFTFDMTAPANKILGTYRYYLRPVVDEVVWLPDSGMYFDIKVQ